MKCCAFAEQGSYIWINTGIANGNTDPSDENWSSMDVFNHGGRSRRQQSRDEGNDVAELATITTFGAQDELVLEVLRRGKALLAKNAHVTTTIFVAKLRQGENVPS